MGLKSVDTSKSEDMEQLLKLLVESRELTMQEIDLQKKLLEKKEEETEELKKLVEKKDEEVKQLKDLVEKKRELMQFMIDKLGE